MKEATQTRCSGIFERDGKTWCPDPFCEDPSHHPMDAYHAQARIEIHVFGDGGSPRIEFWERKLKNDCGLNPLLLEHTKDGLTECHIFSLKSFDGTTVLYHPYATHERFNFHEDLPKFGWERSE